MSPLQYDHFARLLQEEKDDLLKFMAQEGMGKHASFRDSIEELSLIDNHPADIGSELFERSKDLSLHELRLLTLQEINMALERIAEGGYGRCLACGEQIDEGRLQALPYARYCLACQETREARAGEEGSSRPVEELLLYPPFKRTFLDGSDYVAYDGEDAWQDVARYGTSSSPQDVPGATDNPAFVDADEEIGIVDEMDKYPARRRGWKGNEAVKEDGKGEDDAGGRKKG